MHDLVLSGALVVDGSGAPPRAGDVAITGGLITAVGRVPGPARQKLGVEGAVVAPGFIDLHTHVDFTIHQRPDAPSMVRQGVTTLVAGNCGFAPFPVSRADRPAVARWMGFLSAEEALLFPSAAEALAALDTLPLAPNLVQLAGHGTLRWAVLGEAPDAPTPGQQQRMDSLLASSLVEGAVGLSSGLIYGPGAHADPSELVALARVLRDHHGWYATHVRGEGADVLRSIDEAIALGRATGVPVHISHLKAAGPSVWGVAPEILAVIERARGDGLDVTADQYPYTATSTKLASLIGETQVDADSIVLHGGPVGAGRTLAEVAADRGIDPIDLVRTMSAAHGDVVQVIRLDRMAEADVDAIVRAPDVAVASDGWTLSESVGGNPHPRSYGTFARILGRYVRERRVIDLATAVRKMTAVPAARLGLRDRGSIRAGAVADLVVFDPGSVAEASTFDRPYRYASGVLHVMVAGRLVVADGTPTGATPGVVLRRGGPGFLDSV